MSEKYSVTSNGTIKQGLHPSDVIQNIQHKFGVSAATAGSLVAGNKSFIKDNLDKFTAQQYYKTLIGLGLIASIEHINPNKNKNISSQSTKEAPPKTSLDTQGTPPLNKKPVSGILLKYGALIFAISMIASDKLRDLVFLDTIGFSLGYIPYMTGYILMALGSYFFAVEKKLPVAFRALSLLSFFGLALILLLNPSETARSGLAKKTLAITILLTTAYWFFQYSATEENITQLISDYQVLDQGRIVYPSKQTQTDLATIEHEVDELISYIDRVFDLLNNQSIDIEMETVLTNSVMQGTASIMLWLKYQQALYQTQGSTLASNILDEKLLNSVRLKLLSHIDEKINAGVSDRVRKEREQWFHAIISFDDRQQHRKNKIHSSLIMYQATLLREFSLKASSTNRDLRKLMKSRKIKFRGKEQQNIDGHFIVITLPTGSVNNPEALTLIMACYISEAEGKASAKITFEQVGGDYPNYYLGRKFLVLRSNHTILK